MAAALFFIAFNFYVSVWLPSTLLYLALCFIQKTITPTITHLKIGLGEHLPGLFSLLVIVVMYDQADLSVWLLLLTVLIDIFVFVLLLIGVCDLLGVEIKNLLK